MAANAAGSSSSRVAPLLPLMSLSAVFFFLLAPAVAVAAAEAAAPPGLGFHVGGPRGWHVPDANTSYDWWATNNRFRVGDRLYFRYAAQDSVLLVDREDFEACNATAPLAAFADGATAFVLDRLGFFCFISGEPGHCEHGQRLIVRVMVHPALAAPGPASAPGASGHGGAPSGADTAVAAAAGVAVAAALAVLVSLALMLQ